jgi:cyclopropane fatty-acyl-phospholipid synthase-like methyltransferase
MNKPDYGLDAPGVILGVIGSGAALVAVSLWLPGGAAVVVCGAALTVAGFAMFASSRYAKLSLREHLLDAVKLRGDERVLDVGCGRGLLLIGAAKRLSSGKAIGLDLWIQADQLHNGRAAALGNAALEGVDTRVTIQDGDMRAMPFENASFDVVVSSLAIHNVPTQEGRRRSISEIARVLRPGGRVALMDLAFTAHYARWLQEAGLTAHRSWPARWFFPPLGIVLAEKTAGP